MSRILFAGERKGKREKRKEKMVMGGHCVCVCHADALALPCLALPYLGVIQYGAVCSLR